jgi:hypothetical protein
MVTVGWVAFVISAAVKLLILGALAESALTLVWMGHARATRRIRMPPTFGHWQSGPDLECARLAQSFKFSSGFERAPHFSLL